MEVLNFYKKLSAQRKINWMWDFKTLLLKKTQNNIDKLRIWKFEKKFQKKKYQIYWWNYENIEKHWDIETLKTLSGFSIYWISSIEFNSMLMWKIKTLKRYSMSMSMSIFSIFQCETQCSMSICRPLIQNLFLDLMNPSNI